MAGAGGTRGGYGDGGEGQGFHDFNSQIYSSVWCFSVSDWYLRGLRMSGISEQEQPEEARVSLKGLIHVPVPVPDEIRTALETHIDQTRKEKGCLQFNVVQSKDDKSVFEVSEVFVNKAAFDMHQQRVKTSDWGLVSKDLVREYVLSDSYWMQRALELALEARLIDEVPVGAVVVLDQKIIGEGFNQPISRSDPTAHAEIMAIRQASANTGNYRLAGAVLYSTIEPCSMCAGAMVHARIRRLVYGAAEPRAGAVDSTIQVLENQGLNHRVQVESGVMKDTCGDLISQYFKGKR